MNNQLQNFKKNLQILKKTHPSLAHLLATIDPSHLEVCWTQNEELNLKCIIEGQIRYYHCPISARKEAQEWFQSLDLHLATLIFIYGLGLGYYYEAAQPWLRQHPHHALVFLEEDLSVIFRLCETELGWKLLKDPQVQVIFLQNSHSPLSIFNKLTWTYFETPYIFSGLNLYQETKSKKLLQLSQDIHFQFEQKKLRVEEYLNLGVSFFRNFYLNLLELPHAYWGNALFNCFPQVPAIICGEGPSLHKNSDILSTLKEKALLIAGGSALTTLIAKGIIPHFGVAIDSNTDQYSYIAATQSHSIPFFYRNRLFHEALAAIEGPHLYLNGEEDYATSQWFEKQLNIIGEELKEGYQIVSFSLQIARALGCNPIIIVGTDLAFSNKGYESKDADNINLINEEFSSHHPATSIVQRQDLFGKLIYTSWKWVKEAEWISHFAARYPDLKIVNATEGGLGFEGIPNLSLKRAAEKFLKQTRSEITKIDKEIQKKPLDFIPLERIVELLQEMKESLDYSIYLFSKMLEEMDVLVEQIEQGAPFPPALRLPTMEEIENAIEREIAYPHLLEIFGQIFIHLHHRSLQDLQSSRKHLSEKNRALQKLEFDKQRFIFFRDVARCNRELIQRTLDEHNAATKAKKEE